MKTALRLRVTGLVQGVFFRASLAEAAQEAKLSGWVRNMADGSVEALLEGEREAVQGVVEWARRGPPGARVDSVEVRPVPAKNLKGFKIAG
jgi:acylphosphatase